MTIVLFFSDRNDAVVCGLLSLPQTACKVELVYVDELVPYTHCAEWPIVLSVDMPGRVRELLTGSVVINRIFAISNSKIGEYLRVHSIDERWFFVRLMQHFEHATVITADSAVRGTSRALLPLYAQWWHAERFCRGIKVPNFQLASGRQEVDRTGICKPRWKPIWPNIELMNTDRADRDGARGRTFAVERPRGVPVILYYFGASIQRIMYPVTEVHVSRGIARKICELCRACFHCELGEALIYIASGDLVLFYAFSPFLAVAGRDQQFSSCLARWIDDLSALAD